MNKEFDKRVGDILRVKRIEKKMTQLQLAEKIGVAESTYGCWETGHRGMNLDDFFLICEVLEINPNDVQKQLM